MRELWKLSDFGFHFRNFEKFYLRDGQNRFEAPRQKLHPTSGHPT
jgi:hypothetical protein